MLKKLRVIWYKISLSAMNDIGKFILKSDKNFERDINCGRDTTIYIPRWHLRFITIKAVNYFFKAFDYEAIKVKYLRDGMNITLSKK